MQRMTRRGAERMETGPGEAASCALFPTAQRQHGGPGSNPFAISYINESLIKMLLSIKRITVTNANWMPEVTCISYLVLSEADKEGALWGKLQPRGLSYFAQVCQSAQPR